MQENVKLISVRKNADQAIQTEPIWQYDIGHVLSLEGFDNLPDVFQMHFAKTLGGDSITQVGQNGQVTLPDEFAQTATPIYAWVYVAEAETGLTKYLIMIPVMRRAAITNQVPTPVEQSAIDQAISALNDGVTRAETAAGNAEQSAESASESSGRASSAAQTAENAATTATTKATEAAQSASSAAGAASAAAGAAQTATTKATEASGSAAQAKTFAESASASASAAQSASQTATTKATEASRSASTASQKAQEATSSASAASQSASSANTAKQAAETAMEWARGYAGNASIMAQEATQSKNTSVEKAGEASQSATNAAQSAQAAAQTAQQFAQDITQLKSDIQAKQDAPSVSGTVGQVLSLDGQGNPVWTNVQTESEIDDTAGEGDTDKAWSADKLVSELQDKADVIISSASGAIASFPDGAAAPVEKLVVNIEPVQDLHGYDYPWPAGGGKNLLKSTAQSITKDGISFIVNDDGSVLVNGTATANTELVLATDAIDVPGDYIVNGCPDGGNRQYWMNFKRTVNGISDWKQEYGSGFTVTGGTIQNVGVFVQRDSTLNNVLFKPMIRLASEADATYAPYSNICPISGWTGANVTGTGKNLLPSINETQTISGITWTKNADGSVTLIGTSTENSVYDFGRNSLILKAGTYTTKDRSNNDITLTLFHTVNGTVSVLLPGGGTFTLTQDEQIFLRYFVASGKTVSKTIYPQIELGSTATDYKPYSGQTYEVEFPSEAGTVYGCMLTVNRDGTGSLVVDRAYYDGSTWTQYNASNGYKAYRAQNLPLGKYDDDLKNEPISNAIGEFGSFSSSNMCKNMIQPPRLSSSAAYMSLKDGLDPIGISLSYLIATPITYALTAEQISGILSTLHGNNNIWADCGSIESVEYSADTKLYIDNKITQAIAAALNS